MAEDVIEGINPTRMELLNLKRKLKLAQRGHHLLEEKKDALMLEYSKRIKAAEVSRQKSRQDLASATSHLVMAKAAMGSAHVASASLVSGRDIEVALSTRNLMGLRLPSLKYESLKRGCDQRGYQLALTSPAVDEAASSYENLLESMISLAENDASVTALHDEIEKTKRRVNALEYRLIPRLTATRRHIQMRLDEVERESFFRLKNVKKKKAERKKAKK